MSDTRIVALVGIAAIVVGEFQALTWIADNYRDRIVCETVVKHSDVYQKAPDCSVIPGIAMAGDADYRNYLTDQARIGCGPHQ